MTAPETPKPAASVTIDGAVVEARAGELLIKVAEENGVFIPRFCWHERMKPVGMCRMCLVEVDGMRGLPPACTLPVADGMVCHTQTPAVKQAQDDVLEFLLINHPLDCPVCDRGGECPLQDQTLAFGPGESRFVEEKRHFEKPIAISDVVLLDRERCIQCARCTRFADEIAGDPLISFVDRGTYTQVLNHPDHPFASYFSGNVVQICPVGALTAKPYRFRARPWDLATAETSCTQCAVQCRGAVQSSTNRLVRLLGVDSEAVNQGWLCDKGRYGFEFVHSDSRVLEPQVDGEEVSWPAALDVAAATLRNAVELHGAASIAVLGGARGTTEDAYAWARLAKGVIGTDNVDAQLGDGLPAEAVLGLPRATIADCDQAAAIVLLAGDLKEELPVLHLRVRRAVVELGVPLIDLGAVPHGLSAHVTHPLAGANPAELAATLASFDGEIVVVLGRANLAESAEATLRAAAALAQLPNVKFLSALRRGNVHGALEVGLAPGLLPGRVSLDAGQALLEHWRVVPETRGLDSEGILRAAADGKLRVLVLIGADPIADFPDRELAKRAIANVDTVIAIDAFTSESNRRAKVFLPATLWAEKSGTVVNLEGRVQRVAQKVSAEGAAMDDWRIAAELAFRLGADFDLESVDEVTEEIARVAPAFSGGSAELFRNARDGVVLPVAEHLGEVVLRRAGMSILAGDGASASWEPIKVDAEESGADGHGVVERDEVPNVLELLTWDRHVASDEVPARDAYSLRLVCGRTLYDAGRSVTMSPSISGLRRSHELAISAADMQRLGVTNGTEVKVTSARGSLVVAVRAARGVPAGTAMLSFTADGGVAELIDAATAVTDLRVETLR